jgi:RNA polymerase-binding transcription factor DksA
VTETPAKGESKPATAPKAKIQAAPSIPAKNDKAETLNKKEKTEAAPKKEKTETVSRRRKGGSEDYLLNRDPEQIRKEIESAKKITYNFPGNKPATAPAVSSTDVPRLEKTKFNDQELAEFRNLINKKLEDARNDFDLLKDALSHKDNNGTDDTSPTFKLLEDGSEVLSKEETTQLAMRQQKFIQNLEAALVRIENKTYGICRGTGQMIPKDRLRVVPHATLSIDAKKMQNH